MNTNPELQSISTKSRAHAAQRAGCRGGSARWLAKVLVARAVLFTWANLEVGVVSPPMAVLLPSTFRRGLSTPERALRREHHDISHEQRYMWWLSAQYRGHRNTRGYLRYAVHSCSLSVQKWRVSMQSRRKLTDAWGFRNLKNGDLASSRTTSKSTLNRSGTTDAGSHIIGALDDFGARPTVHHLHLMVRSSNAPSTSLYAAPHTRSTVHLYRGCLTVMRRTG